MATIFETRLIGNIGKDAVVKTMDKGVIALNFPVAHNKNWRDKRTGEQRTKTTWVNCTIWKREGANMRILDFLKKGTLVEIVGTPFAKGYLQDDQSVKAEIRLNVSKTNILRPAKGGEVDYDFDEDDDSNENNYSSDATRRLLEELEHDLF
ncbi:single-stranded DNA-binding protein [Paracrocinitomix mangrovi]|uniref:single-stranded DNA-binding protein n=1 Tax=Paracrocinitomix mangrovi TaxID=2862509 RepID=UPI001C8D9717|nr:single-stranded DNA-binding protein [Paracrocinitomix mangrovi]UKN00354.1 single-stranded DNA-binding protein [Paracrocinitomix mangrovi]